MAASFRNPLDGKFNRSLAALHNGLIEAAVGNLSEYVATTEARVTAIETMNGLAECSPDVAAFGCERCLRTALGRIGDSCAGAQWTTMFSP
ncbi:hypothetical protein Nepgr_028740 [Nepenthes gracilis]|uniref:Gnk2-homologous domain-containing protein n=1 Tax=Nepenthes gracilis TaxID=150966 RepID=A0AAD3TE84_NEPGR|nr:hypothetical protein Nepgr_028740 [Nepenthes gracilis]